jgi:hypothetical protein
MTKIAQLFNIRGRFLRSAHLERDFHDPTALQGYVVTPQIHASFDRIASGLDRRSGQRAWRINGDYGLGKSSLALLLAHLLSGHSAELPKEVRKEIDLTQIRRIRPRLLPVLITGAREPLKLALVRGLKRALASLDLGQGSLGVATRFGVSAKTREVPIAEHELIELIQETNRQLIDRGVATGLLMIFDELGKFLEFAALHPERQDILLLQQLAETSARSGEQRIFVIGLLHQGFNAYAEQLSQVAQREWEKVAGRFEEILFDQPLDQTLHLVANTLGLTAGSTPKGWEKEAKESLHQAISLGWFGPGISIGSVSEIASHIYPLHPTLIPVLVRLFRRFGQNERSLFSFLLSNEPFGLQSFAQQEATLENVVRIHHLYDFAAENFGHRLSAQSYRNHWNHIDSLVRSFAGEDAVQVRVLKTIGLLNLLNSPELQPTVEAIVLALADTNPSDENRIREAIKDLHQEKKVLYFRGAKAGYWLWGHSSINLEIAYEEAGKTVGSHRRVADLIKRHLDTRPVVARRHYIQTGNLRHFQITYCEVGEVVRIVPENPQNADGRIVIPLLETKEDVLAAEAAIREVESPPTVLVGITEPLAALSGLIQEVERWSHVERSTPELKDDRYAYEEVTRQLTLGTLTLERRVQHYVGLRESSRSGGLMPIRWYRNGTHQRVTTVSSFLSLLSDICDEVYTESPRVRNELINRRSLSSAAAAARMRLLERMIESPLKPYLGMNPAKKPPEMSMYLSVLQETKLHRQTQKGWILAAPEQVDDPCHLHPALQQIHRILEQRPDQRVKVGFIFEELKRAPFGVRDGLLPLLLLVTVLENQHKIAVYGDGTFKTQIIGPDILRLTKDPSCFELQLVKVEGVRLEVFNKLSQLFAPASERSSHAQILDIVRPLCQFAAKLPLYARQTERLSEHSRRVRHAILEAREPSKLLFRDLPAACGFPEFVPAARRDVEGKQITRFVDDLKKCLEELKLALPSLRFRIYEKIARAFGLNGSISEFQRMRDHLAQRTEPLLVSVTDPELKAYCLGLFDNHMPEAKWVESIGSLITTVPPSRWSDREELIFQEKLSGITQKFLRVESISFANPKKTGAATNAVRIAVTKKDGSELQEVVYISKFEEEEVRQVTDSVRSFFGKDRRLALATLSKLSLEILENGER